jgi:hypothetical protein
MPEEMNMAALANDLQPAAKRPATFFGSIKQRQEQQKQLSPLHPVEKNNPLAPARKSPPSTMPQKGLVIGKLKVEVLPPPAPVVKTAQRQASRQAGSPSSTGGGSSIGLKLRFGLGQL